MLHSSLHASFCGTTQKHAFQWKFWIQYYTINSIVLIFFIRSLDLLILWICYFVFDQHLSILPSVTVHLLGVFGPVYLVAVFVQCTW